MDLPVPVRRIGDIVHHARGATADTALRRARYFEALPKYWFNLQKKYDIEATERQTLNKEIQCEVRLGCGQPDDILGSGRQVRDSRPGR